MAPLQESTKISCLRVARHELSLQLMQWKWLVNIFQSTSVLCARTCCSYRRPPKADVCDIVKQPKDGEDGSITESYRNLAFYVLYLLNVSVNSTQANSAFHPSGVGKWVSSSAGKAKTGMVHSVSEWTRGVQVKLWDSFRTCAIPGRLRDVFTTRRYTNSRLPYLTLTKYSWKYLHYYLRLLKSRWFLCCSYTVCPQC